MQSLEIKLGKYILKRDERGYLSYIVPPEERSHPQYGMREFAMTGFETALAEAFIERMEHDTTSNTQ